jgi:hypothetical protein
MRGDERDQDEMFSYVSLEQRVPQNPPLREVCKLTATVLRSLSPEFDSLYADSGRPSIAPEYILRALLMQVFYSVRSERLLVALLTILNPSGLHHPLISGRTWIRIGAANNWLTASTTNLQRHTRIWSRLNAWSIRTDGSILKLRLRGNTATGVLSVQCVNAG